jgi:probable biosynthetic protein (TIGR04098 family)
MTGFAWNDYAFTVGMPHMVPGRLSEVELLKWLGNHQWDGIAAMVGSDSASIANEEGDRLYASFIDIELKLGSDHGLHLFEEGARVHLANGTRMFSGQFVEGVYLLDRQPLQADRDAIHGKADLDAAGLPWVSMNNCFVARFGGENDRLKVFAPAGIEERDVARTDERPPGLSEHGRVQSTGEIDAPWDTQGFRPVLLRDDEPIDYEIVPESDLNGAGLLYFARYVAMLDYGERRALTECLDQPLSRQLVPFLSPSHRRIFYFANASPWDTVLVRTTPSVRVGDPSAPAPGSPRHRVPLEFTFRTDLHRASDGVLMASSLVRKPLVVPGNRKGVLSEALRFARSLDADRP